ncbi:hypothetical protein HanIR_Chr16g0843851 [Helianthus annuus]|nr:hypothetical protein HanIR_Chr16g0843851 [Helianthus annuus]
MVVDLEGNFSEFISVEILAKSKCLLEGLGYTSLRFSTLEGNRSSRAVPRFSEALSELRSGGLFTK